VGDILYCAKCEEKIEVYRDGSNIDAVIDFFFEHRLHDLRKLEYP